ncbi:MAG: hypothetical protein CFE36_07055 [Sphingomonadaceae bacterium PASS1]|nr:MAG: hypothetical protein CFE36_07055 [Sphingomonadaceae bacterium PASS1]
MTIDSDLPIAAANHVSSMLILAKQKHGEAMAMVGIPDANAIPRLRQVLQLLDEVELLAEDASSYVENDAMVVAISAKCSDDEQPDTAFARETEQAEIANCNDPRHRHFVVRPLTESLPVRKTENQRVRRVLM